MGIQELNISLPQDVIDWKPTVPGTQVHGGYVEWQVVKNVTTYMTLEIDGQTVPVQVTVSEYPGYPTTLTNPEDGSERVLMATEGPVGPAIDLAVAKKIKELQSNSKS